MKAEGGDHSMINLSVQQVLSLWAHGTVLRNLTEMWYWIFLWALFSSLFVHGAAGVLMFVMLQRHRQGRVISVIAVSIGFLASVTGAMITTFAVPPGHRIPVEPPCVWIQRRLKANTRQGNGIDPASEELCILSFG
ncbi:PREDICTED: transmembrane protein 170B isoform X1 [Rhinopithecus bieti]|uniref:transmembrane protein 170B isoform X1 n=1 Tax=Rhinopithecus bieti TaxID=61621 RepID=UPI00083C2322|nr:PREDICTED: transmembrane protein 170B isoform X1 [Rhinopithecus bieti]